MHPLRDMVERVVVFLVVMIALSGIAYGVADMAGTSTVMGLG